VNLHRAVDIAAPPDIVWAVMSDVERWHEWTQSIRSVRLLNAGPLAVGSRALIRQPKLPPAVWTVTAIDPGRSFTWRSGTPGMWVFGHHAVEPIEGGTRGTLGLEYHGAVGRLLARLTRGMTERYLDFEAAGLKGRSESIARSESHRVP
jgi:uncharacterized membrane protein